MLGREGTESNGVGNDGIRCIRESYPVDPDIYSYGERQRANTCRTLLLALRKKTSPNHDYKRETLPDQSATRTWKGISNRLWGSSSRTGKAEALCPQGQLRHTRALSKILVLRCDGALLERVWQKTVGKPWICRTTLQFLFYFVFEELISKLV